MGILMLAAGSMLLFVALMMLTTTPVAAQCGSESSSCKTCHEVNGQLPVNQIGIWHTDHNFEDYCTACHQGDEKSPTANAAHTDMVDVLASAEDNCSSCHANNYEDLMAVYVTAFESMPSAPRPAAASSADPLAVSAADDPLAVAPAGDPLAVAPAADPLAAPAADQSVLVSNSSAPQLDKADDMNSTGNRILMLLASGLTAITIGVIIIIERR